MNKKIMWIVIVIVVIGGVIWFATKKAVAPQQQNAITTSTPEVISTPVATKVYTNNQFGFSISIPSDFVQEQGDYVPRDYPTKDDNVIFKNAKTGASLIFRSHDLDYPDNLGTKTINGIEWKVSGSSDIEGYTVRYTTNKNGYNNMFSVHKTDETLLNQILASIKFTSPAAIVPYTDSTYKFQFLYPRNWSVGNQSYISGHSEARNISIGSPAIKDFPGYVGKVVSYGITFSGSDVKPMTETESGFEVFEGTGGPIPIQVDAATLNARPEPKLAKVIEDSFKDLLIK
jgi:hypothetical protein